MTDISYVHYGVRYPNGHISDFSESREDATAEAVRLLKKDVAIELVYRKVGGWEKKRTRQQPPRSAP